jgi:hypothetical protein
MQLQKSAAPHRGMSAIVWIAIALVAIILVSGSQTISEGFTAPIRSDVGYLSEGWTEETGYERDLRFTETFTDIQGLGVATDFCRAVTRKGDPSSLHLACAIGRREGMDTMEYRSPSLRDGFRMSRDDYWRLNLTSRRMDYGRILHDTVTGEWFAAIAAAGRDGFKATEEHDTTPPDHIKTLLDAYDGILTWYRWVDDATDYATNTTIEVHGTPIFPTLLKPDATRGLELNRWPPAAQAAATPPAAPADRDWLRWGEPRTLALDDAVPPRQIRAISFWVYWDTFQPLMRDGRPVPPTILDCTAVDGRKNRVWFGVEGGAADLPPAAPRSPAAEVTPQQFAELCSPPGPEPFHPPVQSQSSSRDTGTYVFEIWDEEQRIMRLTAPSAARTGVWQHVVLTTTDTTTHWPTWQMYVNGAVAGTRTEGRTSPAAILTHNYIGRGFRGCLVDFRVYKKPMPAAKREAARTWAAKRLHPVP